MPVAATVADCSPNDPQPIRNSPYANCPAGFFRSVLAGLIDAALDGELPSGSGLEFPKTLDPSDTIQSLPSVHKFSVIQGGKGTGL